MIGYFLPRHNRPFHSPCQWCQQQQEKKRKRLGGSLHICDGGMRKSQNLYIWICYSLQQPCHWCGSNNAQIWLYILPLTIHTYMSYAYNLNKFEIELCICAVLGIHVDETSVGAGLLSKHAVGMRLAPSFLFFFYFLFGAVPLSASLYNSTRASWGEK